MKRMLDITDTEAVVKTTNGATTYTALLYARELKEFTPLPNGFNRELADYIVEYIEAHEGRLWEQGHWRAIVDSSDGSTRDFEDITEVAPWLVTTNSNGMQSACGTSMCFAGWAGELTGADQVVDATAIKVATGRAPAPLGDHDAFENFVDDHVTHVLVRLDDPTFEPYFANRRNEGMPMPRFDEGEMQEYLASRGFSEQTHTILEISNYAAICLGIAHNSNPDGTGYWELDPRTLFAANNNWAQVKAIIDEYTVYGPREVDFEGPDWEVQRLRHAILRHGDRKGRYYWRSVGDLHDEIADGIVAELAEAGIGYDYHFSMLPKWATREMFADA